QLVQMGRLLVTDTVSVGRRKVPQNGSVAGGGVERLSILLWLERVSSRPRVILFTLIRPVPNLTSSVMTMERRDTGSSLYSQREAGGENHFQAVPCFKKISGLAIQEYQPREDERSRDFCSSI
ncbi:MAG TPA: hypothetical protein VJ884_04910, partial [Salinibacter sp.]|nr:hypothetical protein [Salinibacter sp.]